MQDFPFYMPSPEWEHILFTLTLAQLCLFHKTTSFHHVGLKQEIDTHQEGRVCLLCRYILPNFNMKRTRQERKHEALEKNNNHHVQAK